MEYVIAIALLAAFAAFLYSRVRKVDVTPDWGDEQPPRDATAEEVAEFWRNRQG